VLFEADQEAPEMGVETKVRLKRNPRRKWRCGGEWTKALILGG